MKSSPLPHNVTYNKNSIKVIEQSSHNSYEIILRTKMVERNAVRVDHGCGSLRAEVEADEALAAVTLRRLGDRGGNRTIRVV